MYRWDGGSAVVQTVDFFTPIVDDPFTYGQIAAANALSDIYAMGGEPRTALAIAGFPQDRLDPDVIREIFRGGLEKLREAGVALLGGHTVQDPEIKFGYAVTGAIDPARIWSNAGAREGDALLLTKPLGTGVIGTAIKFRRAPPSMMEEAVRSMVTLNRAAAKVLGALVPGTVRACTDVTGFGLIGHASGMAVASRVTVEVDAAAVPLFKGAKDLAGRNRSGGMKTNRAHFGPFVAVGAGVDAAIVDLLYDPQTSGGLLVSIESTAAERVLEELGAAGVTAVRVGGVGPGSTTRVVVR